MAKSKSVSKKIRKTQKQLEEAEAKLIADAQKVLEAQHKKKVDKFLAEYKALCKKHGMSLHAEPFVRWNVVNSKEEDQAQKK